MKIRYSLLIIWIFITMIVSGCFESTADNNQQSEESAEASANKVEQITEDPVEVILKNMSLPEKIGQMTMIGILGQTVDDDSLWMLHQYHCGGVILFDRNMETKEQVKQLIINLNNQSEQKLPLFIAIDEEGGRVARMKHEIRPAPSQEEIGNSGDPESAKIWAINISKELKNLGINVNFAPVADVGSPDTRSFSSDAATVASFVDSAANGYEEVGLLYCLKHFPGIGKRITDPHQEISSIDVSRETLENEDLLPFKSVIEKHQSDKFMIMVSHLQYPAIDEVNPATLSYEVITNLLRAQLNYKGIIITDDLEMGAVANHNDFYSLGVKAVKAGADIVLVCHDYNHETDVYLGILEAVQNGEISEQRIDESVRRILKVKLNNLSTNNN